MQIDEQPEEVADIKTPRNFSRAHCQRIAASYRKACAAGKVKKPMSLFIGRIINAAVSETDR